MSQEPIRSKWYLGVLARCTLFLFVLFAVNSLFAATEGQKDIGATAAASTLKGTIYAKLENVADFDYAIAPFTPTIDFFPKTPVTPKVFYTGRENTTYDRTETVPTLPGTYTAFIDVKDVDSTNWQVLALDNEVITTNFEITTPKLNLVVTTQDIEAYDYTGSAITSVAVEANSTTIPGKWNIVDSDVLLTVGQHTRTLTFAPTETNYGTATQDILITVTKASLYLVEKNKPVITYEEPLSLAAIVAKWETQTDSKVYLTSTDGTSAYANINTTEASAFYPVYNQGATTYIWSFTPTADSFFAYSSNADADKISIAVNRKTLTFDSDIKIDNLSRFYYDTTPASVEITHSFNNVKATTDSVITYWEGADQMQISTFQEWDAATYSVKAVADPTDQQNYTFEDHSDNYKVDPRAIAKVVVDTFSIYADDDILTSAVKTFNAYDVKDAVLGQESIVYSYGGYMSGILNADATTTDTYHKLNINFTSTNKNYARLDTYISVFRFKDPVPFTFISVNPITYPQKLGEATINTEDASAVASIEFAKKDVVYDVITTKNISDVDPNLDGRHIWIAKTNDPKYSDSESWSYVTINQAIMPAHLKSTDTTQEWGKIKIPKLTYDEKWYNANNVRDTAPYTVHFYGAKPFENEISHADIIKKPVGDYYIVVDSVVDSSNYKIKQIVDKFSIKQQKSTVQLATRALPVGQMLSRAIRGYTAHVNVQGKDSQFFGKFEVTNDAPTVASDVGSSKYVYYTLTPYDTNIAPYSHYVIVNVISSSFTPSNIANTPIVYGQPLSETNITMSDTDFATIQWDTPDVIPQVVESNSKSFAYTINVIYDPSQVIRGTKTIEVTPLILTENNVIISNPMNPIYDGKSKEPKISYVGLPAGSLTPTKPNISYPTDNIEPGNKTVNLAFRTNHTGTVSGTFDILPDPKLVENVSDTTKIYNGDYQYATVIANASGSTQAQVDSVHYQTIGQTNWIDSPILANKYNMKTTFSQAGASWTRLDSFMINQQPVKAENFVVSNTTTTVDSGLKVQVDFVGLNSVPSDTEYNITYNNGSTQIPTSVGVHLVEISMIANYIGSYQTTAIIKASPPPEMPPEIPPTPPTPPVIPSTIKEGQVGFINLSTDKNNASEDVKLALVSNFVTVTPKQNLLTENQAPIIIKISMSDDQLFNEELFFKGAKLEKELDNTYIVRLNYAESEWLSLRVNPQGAFLGSKKVTLRLTVASTDPTIRIAGGVRTATVEYISNLIVFDEPPYFSIKSTSDKPHPVPQSLNLLRFINETNHDGIKIYLDDIVSAKGASISIESDSSIKYDYATMDAASLKALQTVGLEDTFTCKLTRAHAVTLVMVTVFTAHDHTLGTSVIVASSEVNLPIFEKTPSSKGQYVRPYEKVKPGKKTKVRNLAIKTARTPGNDNAVLTIAGSVSLINKKRLAAENKTRFTQDILATDEEMTYQLKSLAVTVQLKTKQRYSSVDTQIRILNIVPATFASTDRFFNVTYLDPRNFKVTPYFYFEVQNCGLKPKAWGEYIDIKKKLKKVSFSIVKKDIELNTAEGAPIRMTKAIIPGENGKLIIKYHKILDQNVGRLDLVIDNKNGVTGRTIRGIQ